MKLKLRRNQKSGMTGSVSFSLFFIIELDSDESAALKKYKFGKQIVYETPKGANASELLRNAGTLGGIGQGITATIAAKAMNHILNINDLVKGKELSCKDINEMIATEAQIKEACQNLSQILYVCQHFEGEEVIQIEPFQPDE